MLRPAHKEVLRLRYDDYANWASEDHLIRVEALLKPTGRSPIMAVANIPLSTPELLVQVRPSVGPGRCLGLGEDKVHLHTATSAPPPGSWKSCHVEKHHSLHLLQQPSPGAPEVWCVHGGGRRPSGRHPDPTSVSNQSIDGQRLYGSG